MNGSLKIRLRVVALVALGAAPLSAAAFDNGPIDGQVIDSDTKQPIPAAIVVARWTDAEGVIADSVTVCRHVATAVTDVDGRYHIDKWHRSSSSSGVDGLLQRVAELLFTSGFKVSLDAYKSGMTSVRPAVIKMDEMTGALELAVWSGTHEARMGSLRGTISSGALTCDGDSQAYDVLKAVRGTIYAEAHSIAMPNEADQKIVRYMDFIRHNIDERHSPPEPPKTPAQNPALHD